jgi:N-acyl-D-aspartate/D-glutamate deacylase
MTTGDLLVRGGDVIDGTGGPRRRADVRVRAGTIVEIDPNLRADGEREVDASGALVAPGFIDSHTHFDPTLFWDPLCDPMPLHGVTTVLAGNCSQSLAPIRPDQRHVVTEVFCYLEDLPRATWEASIPWTWETYDEYLRALGGDGLGVNVATLVGHSVLRLFVLGDEAWNRPSTPDEDDRLASILDECLSAGAFGMSTSLGFDEHPVRGKVPSRLADDAELATLVDRLAAHSALLQFIPSPGNRALRRDVERIAALTGPREVESTWINIFHDSANPDLARDLLDFAAGLQADGVRTFPQVSPRPLDIQVNWAGGMSFAKLPEGWYRFVQADNAEKARLITDQTWRTTARAEWDHVPWAMVPHKAPERIRLISGTSPEAPRFVGRSLADLVAARGGHPSDVLADWVAENDLAPGIVGTGVANSDPDGVASTLTHPAAIISNSDAGAHLGMMCASGDTTLLLTRHVRDRGDLTVEEAVRALTHRQADLLGLDDRGLLAPGTRGDVVVFALDELSWEPDELVTDLPAGAARLRRPSGGYRATTVDGVVVQEQGEYTGARPGAVLRK